VGAAKREARHPRLFPENAKTRARSFYPMESSRGGLKTGNTLPIEERARQRTEHGLVGRRYAGEVKQLITVPLVLTMGVGRVLSRTIRWCSRNCIYCMRFD